MGEDGTVSHAIERANGYICQSQGYYPAWVMSDRYARIEVDSLVYSTAMLMGASSRAHEGESLQANMHGLYKATNPMRIFPAVRRHLHKGLQFLTAKTIKKMPEPVQNVTYRAGLVTHQCCAWGEERRVECGTCRSLA